MKLEEFIALFESITATTDTIRRNFIMGTCPDGNSNCVSCAAEFDRWLAGHDEKVYQRGREDERSFNPCYQCGDDQASTLICYGCLEENAAAARGGEQ